MSLTATSYGQPFPRRQARLLVELLSRQDSALRRVLVALRREGKSDLLGQVRAGLFERADGPIPFHYKFETRRDPAALARHFAACFCQQMRAFGMRQPEMLDEPLALLEKELDRPGLPLALTELGREFLALPPPDQLEFAAALPSQFAYREGRPLCLLWDEADTVAPVPAFLSYLMDRRLSWLLTGGRPRMLSMAADQSWPVVSLEPFSADEALSLAEDHCRQFETPFALQLWEDWFEMAGTSPWWIHLLIESAALAGQPLDSMEGLGRIYVQDLASGSLAEWLSGRWQNVVAAFAPAEDSAVESVRRSQLAEDLLRSTSGAIPAGEVPAELWDALVSEEWAEQTALGPVIRMTMIERDWLELARSTAHSGADLARAGMLQAFLLRAEGVRQWRQTDRILPQIREDMLSVSQAGFPPVASQPAPQGGKALRLPEICSMALERASTAELYWCFGFRPGWPVERRDRPEAGCLYLIVVCRQDPSASEVKQWSRRLQQEARALPLLGGAEKSPPSGLGPRYELWLALPGGASLTAVAGERRLRWDALARLLSRGSDRAKEDRTAMPQMSGGENEAHLSELETRAQWLEEELASAREQFRRQTQKNLLSERASRTEPPPAAPPGAGEGLSARLALSVSLLLASVELLALQSQSDAPTLEAVREIQRRTEKLAETLGMQQFPQSEDSGPDSTPPSRP